MVHWWLLVQTAQISILPGVSGGTTPFKVITWPLKSLHGRIWLQYEPGLNLIYIIMTPTTMQMLMVTDPSFKAFYLACP
jgi:hypothetical protein